MAKSKLPKLKPCPFCDGKAKRQSHKYSGQFLGIDDATHRAIYEELTWHIVKCQACGVAQPIRKYLSREESDAAWNARAS